MKKKNRKKISQADKQEWMLGLFALIMTTLAVMALRTEPVMAEIKKGEAKEKIIVIDPGHGGKDPGKIGIDNQKEKDINLSIALLLKEELEKKNYKVILTRTDDTTATGEEESNKAQDMNARIHVMEKEKPHLCVSIHQNSYTTEDVHGAQVFYYTNSIEGKRLASLLQESIRNEVDRENKRQIKPDNSYYILLHSPCPTVIVECGFLSNRKEASNLVEKEYQKKLVNGICKGILEYFAD